MAEPYSWKLPRLGSPIVTDVPFLQAALTALAKLDPSAIADNTAGMIRLANISPDTYQFQIYTGTEWTPITKLKGDASTLNGYDSSIAANPNKVAVRNQHGQLEGDITGNANTADSAKTLSVTLPVGKGGTGAETPEAARQALGVPPTSHASNDTSYGAGNDSVYGHVKLSDATDSPSSVGAAIAATPKAVKLAYDLANTANTAAGDAQSTADGANAAAVKAQQTADSVSGIANEAKSSADTLRTNLNTTNAEVAKKANKDLSNAQKATSQQIGVVFLSDSINATANAGDHWAATPLAVKTAYDKAVNAINIGNSAGAVASGKISYPIVSTKSTGGISGKQTYTLPAGYYLISSYAKGAQTGSQSHGTEHDHVGKCKINGNDVCVASGKVEERSFIAIISGGDIVVSCEVEYINYNNYTTAQMNWVRYSMV